MLEVRGLTVSYGHIEAVRDVSFHVAEGSIVSLVGPNGAGKTTTLNAISGVVPAARGSMRFQGKDITRASAHRRVSEGIVQIPEGRLVLANMTVRENLELGAYRRSASEARVTIAAMEERFPILGALRAPLPRFSFNIRLHVRRSSHRICGEGTLKK